MPMHKKTDLYAFSKRGAEDIAAAINNNSSYDARIVIEKDNDGFDYYKIIVTESFTCGNVLNY